MDKPRVLAWCTREFVESTKYLELFPGWFIARLLWSNGKPPCTSVHIHENGHYPCNISIKDPCDLAKLDKRYILPQAQNIKQRCPRAPDSLAASYMNPRRSDQRKEISFQYIHVCVCVAAVLDHHQKLAKFASYVNTPWIKKAYLNTNDLFYQMIFVDRSHFPKTFVWAISSVPGDFMFALREI